MHMEKIDVLDKGYVRLARVFGSEIDIVNAARVSYDKEAKYDKITDSDARLIRFLKREGHVSPFRHVNVTFEVYAPLMVARQWYKHVVGAAALEDGSAWNESSRRYVTEEPTFYIPESHQWRGKPANSKQGSDEPVDYKVGRRLMIELMDYVDKGIKLYDDAQVQGVCAEQARLFLPAYGMYVRWRWTPSLDAVMHFLNLREAHDSQKEIQEYAIAVGKLVRPHFPTVFGLI